MTTAIDVFVEGVPRPKARPRLGKNGTYTPKATQQQEDHIGECVKAAHVGLRADGEHTWHVYARFHRPRKGADVDNLLKLVLDACNGIIWVDDRQVEHIEAQVVWSGEPGTYISAQALRQRMEGS